MGMKSKVKNIIRLANEKKIVPIQTVSDENNILNGKAAVVIGATGGIGKAIAKSLHASGANVVLCGTNEDKLQRISDEFSDFEHVRTRIFKVNDFEHIKDNVSQINALFSGVDIVVNSAGVHTENVSFSTMTSSEYDRVMEINLKAPYFVFQAFAEYMIENNRGGHFLLVSSSRGSEPAWSPYGISKWGLNGLTQGLAQILIPHGIIVNGIAPGSTATQLIGYKDGDNLFTRENGLERLATPEEIANVAKLLVSPAGDMIVGETIHVSGGRGVFDIR